MEIMREIMNDDLNISADGVENIVKVFIRKNPEYFYEDDVRKDAVYFTEDISDNTAVRWLIKSDDIIGWFSLIPLSPDRCRVIITANSDKKEYFWIMQNLEDELKPYSSDVDQPKRAKHDVELIQTEESERNIEIPDFKSIIEDRTGWDILAATLNYQGFSSRDIALKANVTFGRVETRLSELRDKHTPRLIPYKHRWRNLRSDEK